MHFNRSLLIATAVVIVLVASLLTVTHGNSEDSNPHWSYEGEMGPENWGTLSNQWIACKNGRSQSPIDINTTISANLPEVEVHLEPAKLKILHTTHSEDVINNGHTIQVNYEEGETLIVGDKQFQFLQYHFHTPSEHTIRGKQFPMEMHFVFKSNDGKLAVVGVLIEEGKHNPAFDPIWSNLPNSKDQEKHVENVTLDLHQVAPSIKTTYRYDGSLTTPPCSEGVKWMVMTTPIPLSNQQISAFQKIIHKNNRPIQQLNGRKILTDSLREE